ncbi:GNAT family N-acetyltransferase [Leucothrix pacifica]|uniref:Histone acetyltransferase n=1 Tax=Leucothrix pacifica TaxID=1247513 RepID=A0A317C1Y9_9GAMM|nr:GNAT family N-acetyltransferase [Leucothrix pacifica]PWQ92635.1 histone acetyltransferase [Leucothrix pacifica]
MHIQNYKSDYNKAITDVFYESIHAIDTSVYTEAQKHAWAPLPRNYEAWAGRLMFKRPFLAMQDQQLLGFIELDPDGYIDCMYTHPDHQRQGVGSTLYEHLESVARDKGLAQLRVDASHVAKPFFEGKGFSVVSENQVARADQMITNFAMEKSL